MERKKRVENKERGNGKRGGDENETNLVSVSVSSISAGNSVCVSQLGVVEPSELLSCCISSHR